MKKPERSAYTPIDFAGWKETGVLEISPKFQRRGVWNVSAQSYFIDTLLLGMPVPPLYLRVVQGKEKNKLVREVIDGQQRITAVLSFMADAFALSKNIDSDCKGKRFSELTEDQQASVSQYSFICDVFYGLSDPDVLEIFQRLNTYSVKLNDQELRNGQFFGQFKSAAYSIAYENIEFWRKHRIFSERDIARMQEVENVSELLIVLIDGVQDKKKSITPFYEKFDGSFPARVATKHRFDRVIDTINDTIGSDLAETEFRRVPLFQSLFSVVAHRAYGLSNVKIATPKKFPNATERVQLRESMLRLSEVIQNAKDDPTSVPKKYETFVAACLRQTDNLKPRQLRIATLYNNAFG